MSYVPGRKAATILGIHQSTLRRYADNGLIPFIRTQSGQRRYDVEAYKQQTATPTLICYCRTSSPSQKEALANQVQYMRDRYPNAEIITDIGGGLNFKRKGLISILERLHSGDKLTVVVAHKDRLARFGHDIIRWLIEQNGGELVVLNQQDHSPEQELTEDILAILHTFSSRLHGLRRYRKAIEEDTNLSHENTETDI